MQLSISPELDKVLLYAREEAARTGSASISPDHLMLGILRLKDCNTCHILQDLGIDTAEFKDFLDKITMRTNYIDYRDIARIIPTRKTDSILNLTGLITIQHSMEAMLPEHLLLALIDEGSSHAASFLKENGIERQTIEMAISNPEETPGAVRKVTPDSQPAMQFIHIPHNSKHFS